MENVSLRERVEEREAYWMAELRELPSEYSESNYQRMKYIQETITGLGHIYNTFCRPAEQESHMEEVLY